MNSRTKLVYQINKIIQLQLDRALGYQKARSLTKDPSLKSLFEHYTQQSYYFADKLQAAMALQAIETHVKPSWTGAVYRAWMIFRVRLSTRKDRAALSTALSAEKMMHLSYELLCANKYLTYYYPLLKFTFLKQFFSIKKTKEELETILIRYDSGRQQSAEIEVSFPQSAPIP
ncbi:hypothetical protein GCM10027566_27530 [Arachidicoccus ginsenosidivorans]|jgi:uncharacterized protein (TIGR02284 family)|uniref:DUF2383 domain-containing protein n=1 Tax=Arachidicoccus ginsenosidivorans TaxID=496057 RepID=A0A5B8VPS6_9BACT|nr:DUF2383 domain-containing protein [Arachidicoccus ginsenosidivorans]QEC73627.1 DUF2383 domain-containing protein [Arachidicoccus ginsenosidivorans]